jgi:hypothetical protein
MLHCDEQARGCRVCDRCRFGDEDTAVQLVQDGKFPHVCCLSADARDKCMKNGHTVFVLPDLGVGRETFEHVHQQVWGGALGCWSVREAEHLERLRDRWSQTDDMKGDPREVVKKVYVLMDNEQKSKRQQRGSAMKAGSPRPATSSTCVFVFVCG